MHYKTIHELHDLLESGDLGAEELTSSLYERIRAVEPTVSAYITLTEEAALKQARETDKLLAQGEPLPPLAGIPMGLKDNLCTCGVPTTCASKMLKNFIPPYDATVVKRLAKAGSVFLGKLNMDEFAMGSSTESSCYFPTKNPWDPERVPGGSSGGSAAAVAAGEAIFALGSDTGGSIRQPASFCGVVGLKPTYGRVSRYGLISFASSMDHIGPITRDVTDCAWVLNVIAGHDFLDSTSTEKDVPDYRKSLVEDLRGLKIGVPQEYFPAGMEAGVKKVIEEAIKKLEELGAICEKTSLPHTQYAFAAAYIVATAEASSNLARYDGVGFGYRHTCAQDIDEMYRKTRSEGFGDEVKRRIMIGTYALSAGCYDDYYLKALKVRTLIRQDFDRALEKFDVLVSPTSLTLPFKLKEKTKDPLDMYMSDFCTVPLNMAGLPAISIPGGFSEGLPVGLQIMGKPFDEETILKVAYAFEQNTGYHLQKPSLEVS